MDWNFICRVMRNIDKQSEMAYQRGIKEMVLETALGWRSDQITEQMSLQIGSTERLVPDLLLQKDERNSLIIEVKKPGRSKSERNVDQLLSYMKQLEIPVGICWGETVEIYWKTIGDGSVPVLLLSLKFNPEEKEGEVFMSLFSEDIFNIEKIREFKNECQARIIFDSKVKDVLQEVLSSEFHEKMKVLIGEYLLNEGVEKKVVAEVMKKISVSIFLEPANEDLKEEGEKPIGNAASVGRVRANRGVAQRYAYELIRQIIEKNAGYSFNQLFAIFKRKNRIERISEIKDPTRWFLADEDIITLSDGTKVAVSNQWGLQGSSKPNLDNLRKVAEQFGIDVTLPY